MTDEPEFNVIPDPEDPLVGKRIGTNGDYLVQARIGTGAYGAVYRGWDHRGARPAAIKVFTQDVADRIDAERFRREALRFGVVLRHPNIVRVFGFVPSSDVGPFIVYELVEGRTLGQIIEAEGALPVPEAIRVARDAAVALQFAHGLHIVHRDMKPSNVMIRDVDRNVMVLDFGIAKDVGSTEGLTARSEYLGTPGYSAPEQELGKVDHRADVFSLGVVLYESLTGSFAFDGRTVRELRLAVLNRDPVPPETINPAVDARLSGLISKMLEKRVRRRPQDMGEVIAALDAIRAGLR